MINVGSLVTAPAIDCGLHGAGACPDGKVHLLSAKPHSILMQYCLYFTNGQTEGELPGPWQHSSQSWGELVLPSPLPTFLIITPWCSKCGPWPTCMRTPEASCVCKKPLHSPVRTTGKLPQSALTGGTWNKLILIWEKKSKLRLLDSCSVSEITRKSGLG